MNVPRSNQTDLRRIYQANGNDLIELLDGIITRVQLVAVIRWRVFWSRVGYVILLMLTVTSAIAALTAVYEGRATL